MRLIKSLHLQCGLQLVLDDLTNARSYPGFDWTSPTVGRTYYTCMTINVLPRVYWHYIMQDIRNYAPAPSRISDPCTFGQAPALGNYVTPISQSLSLTIKWSLQANKSAKTSKLAICVILCLT